MAWPIAGPSSPGGASSSKLPTQDPQHSQKPAKTRLRRRRPHVPRQQSPSPGLLTLLASIATSSVTAGCSPTPPAFLCPFISSISSKEHIRRGSDTAVDTDIDLDRLPLAPTPTKRRRKRHLPERFTQGDDGRYRRMDSYTLYGSTVCSNCEPTITSTTSFLDPLNDTDEAIGIDLSTLPTGWAPRQARESKTTTLIICLSLVLAFVICVFIISCLFWRKARAMKYREHDVEMKALRRRKKNDGDDESVVVQEAKVKQKLWARATARWKANARYTARQRRGKRSVISRSAVAANSTLSLPPSMNEASQSSPSLPPSRASSPRPCTSHESHDSHRLAHSSTSRDMQEAQDPTTPPDVSISPPTPTQASPPAYQQPLPRNQRIPEDDMSLSDSLSRKVLRQHSVSSRHPSFTESSTDEAPIGDSLLADDSISYTPSINSAHVATDDKSLLARLGEMASEPPVDHSGSSSLEVSAPVWQDDFAEFPHDGVPQETGASPQSSANSEFSAERNLSAGFPLPPPPISHKGKLAELSYYEHSSYSYDDLVDAHGFEPSAPPFSEAIGPSAPPLDEEQVQVSLGVPSAPPLVDESSEQAGDGDRHTDDDSMSGVLEYVDEEDVLDASHSAGSSAALTPSQVQAAAVALQDSQSSPPSPLTPSTSADYPRHRVSLIESSQDLVANDSVPLPRYQP